MPGVIFEGADASGKSTLAREVAKATGRELYLAGGKPKDDAQMWDMIDDQHKALRAGKLVDRVSSISQQVYREGLYMRGDLIDIVWRLIEEDNILVYCRPPEHIMLDPQKHEWKPYDTEEWKAQILGHQPVYIQRYDLLMTKFPCVVYDWTSEESFHIKNLLMNLHHDGVMESLREAAKGAKR